MRSSEAVLRGLGASELNSATFSRQARLSPLQSLAGTPATSEAVRKGLMPWKPLEER
jgi:hypothetical protein